MTFSFARRIGCAIFLAGALAMPAAAQAPEAKPPLTPEHMALARAVLDFTGAGKSFEAVIPKLLQDARNVLLRTQPALQTDLDPIVTSLSNRLATLDDDLIEAIAKVYAQQFTEEELKDIAGFYQSAAGQKLTEVQPQILRESYLLAQEWSRRMSVEVMNQIRMEMKKKGHDL